MSGATLPASSDAGWFIGSKSIAVAAALYGALETGLLASLLTGPRSLEEHCAAARVSPRVARRVIDLLLISGLVVGEGDGIVAAAPLVEWARRTPGGIGVEASLWTSLPDALRAGGPVGPQRTADDIYRVVAPRLVSLGEGPARALAERVRMRPPEGFARTVLDVGCGSGVYGLALALRHDDVRVTGLDFPGPLEAFAARAHELGVAARTDRLVGDAATADVARQFDVVLIANVLRVLGADVRRVVLDRAARWVAPGGMLVVVDAIGSASNEGRVWGHALYALHLALRTTDGEVPEPAWIAEVAGAHGLVVEDQVDLGDDTSIQGAVILRRPG